ncbi:hypothetical protein BFJ63_vAg15692 [Fusarium oxysporum f. sp. narcissi]|uniref:Uncharacterized protein n=2 Tax=Fusarium oxysporum TaxID=5507 RepID=A0A4Q2V3Z4_FUSOX|nr:hypothetical protein BFJ65_g7517 [Fusarium oxysporum f. sp. cepae]RKK45600.1 hypothetical protein BFJ67_g8622 [Fusarium oxysporum f. sp. cepae]RKK48799.1 hypothetical protein BFJ66_g7343 [Fusarium oxysporum f. sp. cepae]RKK84452.1 hypothetical protein BFJ71_g14571 [Fusarium oxysporum]RYC81434.1 hypothetical protein BFJ63_vAg15692 [Fusarium oxysporum f. sp. narcissi]
MLCLSLLTISISLFANCVFCKTKFLRPPEWNADIDLEAGWEKNIEYKVGDTIQLLWETDLDKVELYLIQRTGPFDEVRILLRIVDSPHTAWKAEWDAVESLEGKEDSVYCFALGDPDELRGYIAETQSFNVTAPELETTTATTIQSMPSSRIGTSATEPIPTTTTTNQSFNSDAALDSDSGMSKGKIAGVAVGGTTGSLILLGVIGWLVWRRLARSKKDTDVSVVSQRQHQQFHSSETKAELPGDPVVEVYPSGYARSPPGLHEAP